MEVPSRFHQSRYIILGIQMRSAAAVQRSIDVLRYLRCRLEYADLLQEGAYDIEAKLITVWMLAVAADGDPVQYQREPDRPRTLLVTPVGNEVPKKFFSVFQTPAVLGVAMRIGLGHCTFQGQELFRVGRKI
ncbi:MAG: hypothetical protein DMG75_04380 [Acidobacteria bacterium]|nr:MAG: hypothetical protein DMG75_04380 [Acidobacteriota bacterium]